MFLVVYHVALIIIFLAARKKLVYWLNDLWLQGMCPVHSASWHNRSDDWANSERIFSIPCKTGSDSLSYKNHLTTFLYAKAKAHSASSSWNFYLWKIHSISTASITWCKFLNGSFCVANDLLFAENSGRGEHLFLTCLLISIVRMCSRKILGEPVLWRMRPNNLENTFL